MTIPEIRAKADQLFDRESISEVYQFAQQLEESLHSHDVRQTNPEAYREIAGIIFQLYIYALPRLKTDRFEKLLMFNILEALSMDLPSRVSFIERLELRYFPYPDLIIKEKLQKDCLPLLRQNNQKLGSNPLPISQDNPNADPTVKHWLEYYDRKTSIGETSSFERSRFLSNDLAVQALSESERTTLRKLLTFYDYLLSPRLEHREETSNGSTRTSYTSPKDSSPSISQNHNTSATKTAPAKVIRLEQKPQPLSPNNTINLKKS